MTSKKVTAPRGIIGIPCTPYLPDMTLDYNSLARVVEFVVQSGAHGIAYPIMASEFYVLSFKERTKAVETVVRAAGGALPVYVGVTGHNVRETLDLAKHAEDAGAEVLICMTPVLHSLDEARTFEVFHMLDDSVSTPIMLQNVDAYGMVPLSIPSAVKLVRECRNFKYVKEEGMPSILRVEQVLREGKDVVEGVYGGFGGMQLLDELDLGISGTLIACELIDVVAKVFDAWTAGNKNEATRIFQRVLPAIVAEIKLFPAFPLEVLKKRGIIEHSRPRSMSLAIPDKISCQIDRYLEDLKDLMI